MHLLTFGKMSSCKQVVLMEVFVSTATWVSALAANGNNLRMAPKQILKHIKMARSHDKLVNSEYSSVGLGHIFLLFCLLKPQM